MINKAIVYFEKEYKHAERNARENPGESESIIEGAIYRCCGVADFCDDPFVSHLYRAYIDKFLELYKNFC